MTTRPVTPSNHPPFIAKNNCLQLSKILLIVGGIFVIIAGLSAAGALFPHQGYGSLAYGAGGITIGTFLILIGRYKIAPKTNEVVKGVDILPAIPHLGLSAAHKPVSTYPVDKKKAAAYVETFKDPQEKTIAQKLVNNIQHISYEEFHETLIQVIHDVLNPRLKENGNPRFAIGFAKEKSSEWVTRLAFDHLAYQPSSAFYLNNTNCTKAQVNKQQSLDLNSCTEDVLLLFDDCASNADQLINHLKQLDAALGQSSKEVIIIVPYLSNYAATQLYNIKFNSDLKNISLLIFTSPKSIKNLNVFLLSFEEDIINRAQKSSDSPFSKINGFFNPKWQSLAYTDWCYPSYLSFLNNFGHECLPGTNDSLRQEDFDNKKSFIPFIPRIYGKKQ